MHNQYKMWSKEEIIEAIKSFYETNGRVPKSSEFRKENNLPSLLTIKKRLGSAKLKDILNLCDLGYEKFVPVTKIDKNWAIEQLKMYYNKLNRLPTREDFNENNWKPFYDYYRRNFGNFKEACYIAGLINEPLNDEERIKISINILINLANKLNRCPTVDEYDSIEQRGYSRRILEMKLNMKYSDICRKYIPRYLHDSLKRYTEEELKEMLFELKEKLGRVPKFKELKEYNLPGFSVFKRAFGMTYNQVIKSFGWEPEGTTTLAKTKEELLKDFVKLFKELKRIPYTRDFDSREDIASHNTYKKHFGSTKNVCKLLDIDYELHYKNSGSGRICLDNNGDICKSLIERDISNFLIANNIKFKKGTLYSELVPGNKRQFDWKFTINNKTYYVEYFGMFHNNPRGGIDRKYTKKAKKKIKDLYKSGFIDQCIFIFPWDIKHKTLLDIFSPILQTSLIDTPYQHNVETLEYGKYSDEELLEYLMKYSDNPNILPNTNLLTKKVSGLYSEILKRYGSYIEFAELMNKQVLSKPPNYWDEEKVFKIFKYMINTYSKIITPKDKDIIKNDCFCKDISSIKSKYGLINIKLAFFEYCINNNVEIPEFEIDWINKIATNTGIGLKGNVKKEQQKIAKSILNNINKCAKLANISSL